MANVTTTPSENPARVNGSARVHLPRLLPPAYFRPLVSRLHGLGFGADGGLRTVGVTSCQRFEGVSTVSANLAVYAAESGLTRVLAVDANIAHPALHATFSVAPAPGLVDALEGRVSPRHVIQPTSDAKISVVTAGQAEGGAGEPAFPLTKTMDVLRKLAADFQLLVVDLPADDASSPLANIESHLDGVLLVVEAGRVPDEWASRHRKRLTAMGANLLGAVLNKTCNSGVEATKK